jgi:hypothetical protein
LFKYDGYIIIIIIISLIFIDFGAHLFHEDLSYEVCYNLFLVAKRPKLTQNKTKKPPVQEIER